MLDLIKLFNDDDINNYFISNNDIYIALTLAIDIAVELIEYDLNTGIINEKDFKISKILFILSYLNGVLYEEGK